MLNPRLLIYIDNLFSIPYKVILYLFMFSRQQKTQKKTEEVFVLKMMGIGSITRVYNSLLHQNVDFNKTLFISLKSNKDLFNALGVKNVKLINDTNLLQLGIALIKLVFFIRKRMPSKIINYEKASNMLGLFQIFSTCFTKTGTTSFHDFKNDISSNIDNIYSIQGKPFQELINTTYSSYSTAPEKRKILRHKTTVKAKKILININASDYMPFRKYPIDGFVKIIEELHRWDKELSFDLIGSTKEEEYVNSLLNQINKDDIVIKNRCGKWSIADLMNEFADSGLFITNDSGPMHLAAMVDIPMIAIWGPTSPHYFGYQSPLVTNMQPKESCSPCFLYAKSKAAITCNKKIDCLNNISALDIIKIAKTKLSNLGLIRYVNIITPKIIVDNKNYSLVI